MNAVLIRTGSSPVQNAASAHGLLKISIGDHDSVTGILFPGKNDTPSPKSTLLHLVEKRKNKEFSRGIRRTVSETDVIRSGRRMVLGSRSFPARIPEEKEDDVRVGSTLEKKGLSQICEDRGRILPGSVVDDDEDEILKEELEFFGGGIGKGKNIGGGGGGGDLGGGNADQSKISVYYQEMLKVNPGNALLLRNYGKFLHEVEKDLVKAEECYQRAILADPGDGEVLSLYGKLIWEAHKDEERAGVYFDQAVQASPDDCYVLGSYAQFLWDTEEGDDVDEEAKEEEEEDVPPMTTITAPTLVQAF